MFNKIILISVFLFTISFTQEANFSKANNFELENLSGDFVELNDFIGETPIIINFWATWCKPCIEEMKHYNDLYLSYNSEKIQLIAISVDNEKTIAKVEPFITMNDYNFTVLLDTENEVARSFYVQVVPHTFLLNQRGEIVYSHSGYKKGDEIILKEKIEELISEK